MPRGVYDRSKLKKNNKTEKTEKPAVHAAPTTGAKRGPKGPRKNKASSVGEVKYASAQNEPKAKSDGRADGGGLFLMQEVRANLATLTALKAQFPNIASINTETEAHIEVLGNLRQSTFPQKQEEMKAIASTETVATTTPANGTSATYPATVPMPPAPAVIPTQHS